MTFLENAKVRIQWMHIFSTKVSTKGKIDQLWISWLVGKEHLTVGSSKITRLNYRNFNMSNIEFQHDLQKVNESNKRRMVLCWYNAIMLSRVSGQSFHHFDENKIFRSWRKLVFDIWGVVTVTGVSRDCTKRNSLCM